MLILIGGSEHGKNACIAVSTILPGGIGPLGTSTALILAFFLAYDRTQFGILAASLIGVDLP